MKSPFYYNHITSSSCYTYFMLSITPTLSLDESEIQFDYVRAAGPGGQNVNKVATAVQLRFDVPKSNSLPEDVKERLLRTERKKISVDGTLIITSRRYRTQAQNRSAALQRRVVKLQKAAIRPPVRRATRPSKGVKAIRLKEKKHRGEVKRERKQGWNVD